MTDPRTPAEPGPVDPDVELASAHLDGEVGPDERDRAADPAVQARIAELSSVVDRVRDVPPAPPGLLDDHVARALEDLDTGRTVVSLEARRTRWFERIPLGAVAAVLVVAAFVGFASLASQNRGGDDSATASLESADDSADDSGGDGDAPSDDAFGTAGGGSTDAAEEEATRQGDAEMSAPAPATAYDSYDALADDLRAELDGAVPDQGDAAPSPTSEEMTTSEDGAGPQDPCGAVELLGLDPATVVLARTVLVGPDQVTVVVHDAADGRRVAAVDGSCDVVLDRLL